MSHGPPGAHPAYSPNGARPPGYGEPYAGRPPYQNGSVNFEPMGDYADGKQRKRRGNLPKPVTDILRLWFSEHVAHPYPTEDEKQMLMQRTGLTMSQVGYLRPPVRPRLMWAADQQLVHQRTTA